MVAASLRAGLAGFTSLASLSYLSVWLHFYRAYYPATSSDSVKTKEMSRPHPKHDQTGSGHDGLMCSFTKRNCVRVGVYPRSHLQTPSEEAGIQRSRFVSPLSDLRSFRLLVCVVLGLEVMVYLLQNSWQQTWHSMAWHGCSSTHSKGEEFAVVPRMANGSALSYSTAPFPSR